MKRKVFWVFFVILQAGILLHFERTRKTFLLSRARGRRGTGVEYAVNASTPARDLPTIETEEAELWESDTAATAASGSKEVHIKSGEVRKYPRVMTLPAAMVNKVHTSKMKDDSSDGKTLELVASDDKSTSPSLHLVLRDFERDWFEHCEPDLRQPIRPTCNSVHELDAGNDFIDKVLSMEGNWRVVLRIDPQAILKVLHLEREFDEESYQKHEMDNAVMEHLTASPYIVSSFGFCGQSVVTPFARNSGKAVVKDKTLGKIERLKLARNLARGLAELHAMKRIDFDNFYNNRKHNNSTPSTISTTQMYFAHHDINIANTISVEEQSVIWNDFNLGIYSKHSRMEKDKPCNVPIRYAGELWRSPEEIHNSTNGVLSTVQPSDVYSFGNILFHILSERQPWTHLEDPPLPSLEYVGQQKVAGKLPNLPEKYRPKNMELKVLWKATKACFRLDPAKRPTALQLAEVLHIAYEWLQDDRMEPNIRGEDIDKLFGDYASASKGSS